MTDPHNLRLEKVIARDAVDVTDDDIIRARRAYYGNVTYVDEWVGRLRGALDECGLAADTTILFISDHGDMLGEHGLWYKMSFREWSGRIPLIIHDPSRFSPAVVNEPVAQIDVLPTLIDLALTDTQIPPEPIDPLHGRSLVAVCQGAAENPGAIAISEYLAEGTGAPMLMLRRGTLKYICCETDPEQLFDLANDPNELNNLADDAVHADTMTAFRALADNHWDAAAVKQAVIKDQRRRRRVSAALRIGQYTGWDYDPARDPSQEYTRSHMDLTRFDISSRFPRPVPFKPRWK